MNLVDQAARDRIRGSLHESLVVEAAAGTGKTTELVARIIAVVERDLGRLADMVVVTFTEKAAGELRLRLRAGLEVRVGEVDEPPAKARLIGAIAELEAAHIGTIHSFCADILRERPIEAGVDPRFVVGSEAETRQLCRRTFDSWFQSILSNPPEGVRRFLRMPPNPRFTPREQLERAVWSLAEHRDHPTPWKREPWDRNQATMTLLASLAGLATIAPWADDSEHHLSRALAGLAEFAQDLTRTSDPDLIENELRLLPSDYKRKGWLTWKGYPKEYFSTEKGLTRAEVLVQRDTFARLLQEYRRNSGHDIAALLHGELQEPVRLYGERKAALGLLDFTDLQGFARDLIREDAEVRAELSRRFTHIFVDEFQDTDPLQAEILLLLSGTDGRGQDWTNVEVAPGKLFVVGDPKQSIYRFRRADVRLYEQVKRQLQAQGAGVVHLSTSFRSVPDIQRLVNATFGPLMEGAEDGSQATYVPLDPFRAPPDGQPSVVALPLCDALAQYGNRPHFGTVEELYPRVVASWVRWLLASSGWTVEEGGQQVPIRSRHVCLLVCQNRTSGAYADALQRSGVPHVLLGGTSFHDREEVMAFRCLLAAIEWPDDEQMVYGALKSPLMGHADEDLYVYKSQVGPLHPLHESRDVPGPLQPVAESLSLLGSLHMGRNRRPIADTLVQLLEATRAHAGLAAWPGGEQVLANVLRLVEQAHAFEARGATSFRLFVEELDHQADTGQMAEAPIVEEGSEGVRLMTVHKAKGLEFPVVVLCDPTARHDIDEPKQYVDPARGLWLETLAGCRPLELDQFADTARRHELQENVRRLYVATTRARDLLVVPTVVGASLEGRWTGPLHAAIHPDPSLSRGSRPAPGCPPFPTAEAMLERPPFSGDPVLPGEATPQKGGHRVVHWDPQLITVDLPPAPGLRQTDFLAAPDEPDDGLARWQRWLQDRQSLIEASSVPTLRAQSVTEIIEERRSAGPTRVKLERVIRTWGRPSGRAFGILVHDVLAQVDLEADASAIAHLCEIQGRVLDARPDEVVAAASAVTAALAHPIFEAARQADDVRRECPISVRLPDGLLAEGVIDLAYQLPASDAWVVVDYKTDEDIAPHQATYEQQVSLYMLALRRAINKPVQGVLLHL